MAVGMEPYLFICPKIKHRGVRSHFSQEAQSGNDFMIKLDEFVFAYSIADLHRVKAARLCTSNNFEAFGNA